MAVQRDATLLALAYAKEYRMAREHRLSEMFKRYAISSQIGREVLCRNPTKNRIDGTKLNICVDTCNIPTSYTAKDESS